MNWPQLETQKCSCYSELKIGEPKNVARNIDGSSFGAFLERFAGQRSVEATDPTDTGSSSSGTRKATPSVAQLPIEFQDEWWNANGSTTTTKLTFGLAPLSGKHICLNQFRRELSSKLVSRGAVS